MHRSNTQTKRHLRWINVAAIVAMLLSVLPFNVELPGPLPDLGPEAALAHNLDATMVYMFLDPATQQMLDDRINGLDPLYPAWTPPDTLFKNGDTIGLITKVVPADGTNTGVGGYVDFYVPNGLTVLDAAYLMPDGAGDYFEVPMKGQSLMPDEGAGGDSNMDLTGISRGPNILGDTSDIVDAGNANLGTLPGVYGDTGIFYSTAPETAYGSWTDGEMSNNSGDTVGWRTTLGTPLNAWDAWQMAAYGISGSDSASFPDSPIMDSNGRGHAPWGFANAVAGPESGYAWDFDYPEYLACGGDQHDPDDGDKNCIDQATDQFGPWNRIQYPGSQAADDPAGHADGSPHASGTDASNIGFDLHPGNPLLPTTSQTDSTSPKVVRWAIGQLTIDVPEFVWVQVEVDDLNAIIQPDGCPVFLGDTFGGDAGGDSGGKDHIWRYYDPTEIVFDACVAIGKPANKAVVAVGDNFQYTINFYNNTGGTLSNIVIDDTLPGGVDFISAVPAQNSGPDPLRWNISNLLAGERFQAVVTVSAASSGLLQNDVCVTADTESSGPVTSCSTETVTAGSVPLLNQDKSVFPTAIAPGGTVEYTINISNIGSGPTSDPIQIIEDMPPGFTYASMGSVTVNGADVTGSTTVDATDPTKPIFEVGTGINAGSELLLTFTANTDPAISPERYCNSYTTLIDVPLTTGALACVQVGGSAIGDTVYRDWNGNGVQDPGEEGIDGVVIQATGGTSPQSTSNNGGDYLINGLTAGSYVVSVVAAPGDHTVTQDSSGPVTLAQDEENFDIDFGYQPTGAGSIGDLVFEDVGNDGSYDAGTDAPIQNALVCLAADTDGDGDADVEVGDVGTEGPNNSCVRTNASGAYDFTGLATGFDYVVEVDYASVAPHFSGQPYTESTPNPHYVADLGVSTPNDYNDADFGFWETQPASIGDEVCIDSDADGSCAGEELLPGVTVELYLASDPGTPFLTTETTITGTYSFDNLGPGDYVVKVDATDPDIPGGLLPVVSEIPVTGLAAGENIDTVDFPFVDVFTKSVDKLKANPGEILTYNMTVNYPGNQLLTNVKVTDAIPAGSTYVGDSDSPEATIEPGGGGTGNIVWDLGTNTAAISGTTSGAGSTLYAFQGQTTAFWNYDIDGDSWSAQATTTIATGDGAALASDGTYVYGMAGNNSTGFWRYDPTANTWTALTAPDNNFEKGGSLVYDGTGNLYGFEGNGAGFWRYNISGDTWTAMADAPGSAKYGGALTFDGTYIYGLSGDGKTDFYRYDISGNSWSSMASTPANIAEGGALTYDGTYIYALQGDSTTNFYRYNIGANTWSSMAVTPATVDLGGALAYDGTHIYALGGNSTTNFWRYDIGANSWSTMATTLGAVDDGGALVAHGTGSGFSGSNTLSASPSLASDGATIQVSMVLTQAALPPIGGSSGTVDVQVNADTDDAEENRSGGTTGVGNSYTDSSDLELIDDSTYNGLQTVGMRFQGVSVPQGANITNAYVTFTADVSDSGTTNLTFSGQDADDTVTFGTANLDISSRPKTTATVSWTTVPAWTAGNSYNTPNLGAIVEEIVGRAGWASGNDMVIFVNKDATDSGLRTATAHDTTPADAPALHIEWEIPGTPGGYPPELVTPSLVYTGTNGVTATPLTGPLPASAVVTGTGTLFTWTYQANANGNIGSVVFGGDATDGNETWPKAVSNSVLVAPPLSFQVLTADPTTADPVVNTATLADDSVIPPTDDTARTAILDSIGNFVWADVDGQGDQDTGEPGIGGVTVCATPTGGGAESCDVTAADGSYRIFGLDDGVDYDVVIDTDTLPAGYLPTTPASLTVTAAQRDAATIPGFYSDADFGARPPGTSSIGDTVWIDANEDGVVNGDDEPLPNVTVNLYDAAGTLLIASTTTDENGNYSFDGLHGDTYQVQVDESSTVTITDSAGDTTNSTIGAAMELVSGSATNPVTVVLPDDTDIDTVDFGYNWAGSIGDYTYYDPNATGTPGGGGTSPAGLVTVLLYEDTNGDGKVTPGEPILEVGETDGSGAYLFDNLPPGDYIVNADEQTVESPTTPGLYSQMVSTTGTKHPVTLAPSQDYTDADFGFIEAAELEGHVFHDVDNNGVKGGTEPGLGPVTVFLNGFDVGNNPISLSVETEPTSSGEYKFIVPPGTYTITYDIADVGSPSGANRPDLTEETTPDSITRSVTAGQEVGNLDFGVDNAGSIGDLVWLDDDQSGGQNLGEPGISGVTVELYLPGDIPDVDSPFMVQATDGSGNYLFEGLADGTYTVRVLEGVGTALDGYTLVSGTNPHTTATVSGGGSYLNADFGYDTPTVVLSGRIYNDLDDSGNDEGEPGFGDVTVVAECDTGTYTTESDPANGNWSVVVPVNSNCTILTADSNDLPSAAYTATEIATPPGPVTGDVSGLDFGFHYEPGSISGTICDGDISGECLPGEPPLVGVTVTLTYAGVDGILGTIDDTETITHTNGSGDYIFPDLEPGLYTVNQQNLPNYDSVSDADGGNPDVINQMSAASFVLGAGEAAVARDFEDTQAITGNPDYIITKLLDGPDVVRTGDTITFTIRIFNSGDVDLTTVPLEDTYIPAYMAYVGASIEPDDNVNDGTINWANLTAAPPHGTGQPLQPGTGIDVKVEFVGRLDTTLLLDSQTVNTATGVDITGGGQIVPNKVATDTVQIFNPTAALIADHSVHVQETVVALGWETVSESEIVAFNLYRTEGADVQVKLNSQLIAAQLSGQPVGAVYTYVDGAAPEGVLLGYELEMIMADGTSGRFYMGAAIIGGYEIFLPMIK